MKSFIFLAIILSLFASCSSNKDSGTKDPDQMISEYLEDQKIKHQGTDEKTKAYLKSHEDYLKSVKTIYSNFESDEKFTAYLEGLMNQSKKLEKVEAKLPDLYAKETGKQADEKSRAYQLWKTKTMTSFYDELTEDRALRLKEEVSGETYAELMANYLRFNEKSENGKTELRVPL